MISIILLSSFFYLLSLFCFVYIQHVCSVFGVLSSLEGAGDHFSSSAFFIFASASSDVSSCSESSSFSSSSSSSSSSSPSSSFPSSVPSMHTVIVIDAGSTGTRSHIIKCIYNENDCNGRGSTTVFLPDISKKVSPGIAIFAQKGAGESNNDNDEKLEEYLNALRDFAYEKIPEEEKPNTVVLFKGTAGIRHLSHELQKYLLEKVKKIIKKWGFLYDKEYSVDVLSGVHEGIYGWVILNQMLGNFSYKENFLKIQEKGEEEQKRGNDEEKNTKKEKNNEIITTYGGVDGYFSNLIGQFYNFIDTSNKFFRNNYEFYYHDSNNKNKNKNNNNNKEGGNKNMEVADNNNNNNNGSYDFCFSDLITYYYNKIYRTTHYYYSYFLFFFLRAINGFLDTYFPSWSFHNKVGMVEMGGASAQIVFEPPAGLFPKAVHKVSEDASIIMKENNKDDNKNENSAQNGSAFSSIPLQSSIDYPIYTNKLNQNYTNLCFCNKEYVLYAKSYQGLGRQLALQNFLIRLSQLQQIANEQNGHPPGTNNELEVDVSCLHSDLEVLIPLQGDAVDENFALNKSAANLNEEVKKAKGTSSYAECIEGVLDSFSAWGVEPLPFNVSSDYSIYLTENYYYFNEYVVMNDRGSHMCASDFLKKAEFLCKLDSLEVRKLIHNQAALEKSQTACFGLTFMAEFLMKILRIKSDKVLRAAIEINDVDITWTAGAALVELPYILRNQKMQRKVKNEPTNEECESQQEPLFSSHQTNSTANNTKDEL